MFVFYDTETTGLNKTFDQILQFAAILTDENFNPIDEINVRCRILPWVIPAPAALRVTGVSAAKLASPALPSFYQMMGAVRAKFDAWSPAIFLGYNSIGFDENFLHQAFWQTLHPPYQTVTNGNARMDVLPLVRAAAALAPGAFEVPENERGQLVFKLETLAPATGYVHDNAHDALEDVRATIHVAKRVADRVPDLWRHSVRCATKARTSEALSMEAPVLMVDYFKQPNLWWGQRLDADGQRARFARVVNLGADWSRLDELGDDDLSDWALGPPRALRNIALNKAPIVFPAAAAERYWGQRPDPDQLRNSARLSVDRELRPRLLKALEAHDREWPQPEQLEDMIYQGFPSRADEALMARFHSSGWRDRAELVHQFADQRYRRLAQRLVYLDAPDMLSDAERQRIESGIARRCTADPGGKGLWRTLSAARAELDGWGGEDQALAEEITQYLDAIAHRYPPA